MFLFTKRMRTLPTGPNSHTSDASSEAKNCRFSQVRGRASLRLRHGGDLSLGKREPPGRGPEDGCGMITRRAVMRALGLSAANGFVAHVLTAADEPAMPSPRILRYPR